MDNIGAYIVPAAIVLVAISIVARGIRIVQQAQTMIIERLGKYHRTLSSGINLVIPIIDKPRAEQFVENSARFGIFCPPRHPRRHFVIGPKRGLIE